MTQNQEQIETLRLAWQLFLGDSVPVPCNKHLGIWAFHSGDLDLALQAIEKTSLKHQQKPLQSPESYCWSVLRSMIANALRQKQQESA